MGPKRRSAVPGTRDEVLHAFLDGEQLSGCSYAFSSTMARFADGWVPGPFGVTPRVAEQLQELLEPGDRLRFVFPAETKRNAGRLLLYVLLKASVNTLGQIYVVITDRSVLLVDREELLLGGRVVYADLPLPSTLGPVTGRGWIVLDGRPMYVVGGRTVIEEAEAALRLSDPEHP